MKKGKRNRVGKKKDGVLEEGMGIRGESGKDLRTCSTQ